jgi:hypothetical protein
MATDTQKYASEAEREARHSALAEFSRDERRPAVLLLSALVIAVLFFAIGLLVGRWTAEPSLTSNAASSGTATQSSTSSAAAPTPQPTATPTINTTLSSSPDDTHHFAILVATYNAPEKSQPIIKTLQEAGYTDIRTTTPRAGDAHPTYSVLVGRFTQDEARETARRMRSGNNPLLKNAKVVEGQ